MLTVGADAAIDSDRLPDCNPVPVFLIETLKLPGLNSVTGPAMVDAVLVVSTLLLIVQGLQLGPVIRISAVAGSKLLPVMVRVNCWLTTGGLGLVARLLTVGVAAPIDND